MIFTFKIKASSHKISAWVQVYDIPFVVKLQRIIAKENIKIGMFAF